MEGGFEGGAGVDAGDVVEGVLGEEPEFEVEEGEGGSEGEVGADEEGGEGGEGEGDQDKGCGEVGFPW